jgi:2-keto-4-pentenoate hydratase
MNERLMDERLMNERLMTTSKGSAGGEVVSTGIGAAVLGHPLAAVAWLAATVRDLGRPLRAGEVILSGSLGPMVPVAPGDAFLADISGLGQVSATFTEGTP